MKQAKSEKTISSTQMFVDLYFPQSKATFADSNSAPHEISDADIDRLAASVITQQEGMLAKLVLPKASAQ
ncbi:MAG: hypothetical protein U1F27_03250 [Turneriella sp.]